MTSKTWSSPDKYVESPVVLDRLKSLKIFGFLRSIPTRATLLPPREIMLAILMAIKVFPSPDIEDVTANTCALPGSGVSAMNLRLALITRNDSATDDLGLLNTTRLVPWLECRVTPAIGSEVADAKSSRDMIFVLSILRSSNMPMGNTPPNKSPNR